MKVVVTGATGFIGRPICADLVKGGHRVTALSRDAGRARSILGHEIQSLEWGAGKSDEWKQAVSEAEAIIHLAGESVAGQTWTPQFKEKIRTSRVEPTRALFEVIAASAQKPSVLVSASAVGFYGDRKDETITEESKPGKGFLPEACQQWEQEVERASEFGVRVCRMRIGIVLGKGGALEKMLHPLPLPLSPWKLGLGGPLGNGKQWMPWIHLDDVVGLFLWAATTSEVKGAVNTTAPNPVTNAEFSHALGRALHRPSALPVPAFALKLLLGEFADTVLTGQKALPTVAQRLGYRFRYTDIDAAVKAALT